MSLTAINELKPVSHPAVSHHLGVRVVKCELTGFPCKQFAALPVAAKADSTKVTWRGAFVDYESALAYASALVAANQLTEEQFDVIKAHITRKLGFLPAIPAVDINQMHPRGSILPETYMNGYLSATSIMNNELFSIPDEKPKEAKPARYEGFEVNSDKKGSLTIDSAKPAFSAQGISQLLSPWEADPEQAAAHCYTWLVTADGAKPPGRYTVTEYATPKQSEQFHGKPGDKKGTKVRALVLRAAANAKPKQPIAAAVVEKNIATPKRTKKQASEKPEQKTVAKKRKTTAA